MSVFSHILEGEIPASFVHRDARCGAFLDINPINPGHVLVVPRREVVTLAELDAATRAHCFDMAVRIGLAQQRALGSRGQHILVNDGRAASQTVPHVHIHVIPRFGGDNLRTLRRMAWHIATITLPRREGAARRRRLDAQANAIASALQSGD